MRAADSMRGTGTEPFELRKGRAGSYKSMKVICCVRYTDGEWLALGQWRFRATTRTAAATATGHSPESLEGRVEAWRSVDAATGRSEKVNIPVSPNRETSPVHIPPRVQDKS